MFSVSPSVSLSVRSKSCFTSFLFYFDVFSVRQSVREQAPSPVLLLSFYLEGFLEIQEMLVRDFTSFWECGKLDFNSAGNIPYRTYLPVLARTGRYVRPAG